MTLSDPIVVLGSGQRCGSTLVQRLISSHPDVLVWGEHDGALGELFGLVERLLAWERRYGPASREAYARGGHKAWMANLTPEPQVINDAAREFVRALFKPSLTASGRARWGFKEVSYDATQARQLTALFPDCRIVHVTRDPRDIAVSLDSWERGSGDWTRTRTERALRSWLRINASFLGNDTGLTVLHARYEEIVANPAGFARRLADFLELEHGGLDLSVFDRRIHSLRNAPRVLRHFSELDAELQHLARNPELVEVAGRYGYDL